MRKKFELLSKMSAYLLAFTRRKKWTATGIRSCIARNAVAVPQARAAKMLDEQKLKILVSACSLAPIADILFLTV